MRSRESTQETGLDQIKFNIKMSQRVGGWKLAKSADQVANMCRVCCGVVKDRIDENKVDTR